MKAAMTTPVCRQAGVSPPVSRVSMSFSAIPFRINVLALACALTVSVGAGAQVPNAAQSAPAPAPAPASVPGVSFEPVVSEHMRNAANSHLSDSTREVSQLGGISVQPAQKAMEADGVNRVKVKVVLTDKKGQPLKTAQRVTVNLSGNLLTGQSTLTDADPDTEGFQVDVRNGEFSFELISPVAPGDVRIRVAAAGVFHEQQVAWLPQLRPMFALGLIDAVVGMKKISFDSLTPVVTGQDAFEQEIRSFASRQVDANGNEKSIAVRGNFFLKGKISGNALLTAAYDSDKVVLNNQFKDIRSETFYPVYGDSSVKGFDANSTQRLYVRIDKDKSFLLLGDINTAVANPAVALGAYNRLLPGAQAHYETNRLSVNIWASHDNQSQVIRELPANGTSGPYQFDATGQGIVNSERIEILVRDRRQPSVIISTTALTRYVDYNFEPFSGRLIFKNPIPSVDENLNPVSVRASYEVDQASAEKFWVYAANAQFKVTDRFEIGGQAVRSEQPGNAYSLNSINASAKPAPGWQVVAEVAQSRSETDAAGAPLPSAASGLASRAEATYDKDGVQARVFIAQTDKDFVNSASPVLGGRREIAAKVTAQVAPDTKVFADGQSTVNRVNGDTNTSMKVGVITELATQLRAEVGLVSQSATGAVIGATVNSAAPVGTGSTLNPLGDSRITGVLPNDTRAVYGRLTWHNEGDRSTAYVEASQDVTQSSANTYALGTTYRVTDWARLYARHEHVNSVSGLYGLGSSRSGSATVLGVDTTYAQDGTAFSEFRSRDVAEGDVAQWAVGLRHGFTVAPGLRAVAGFEELKALSGAGGTSRAVSGGLDWTANPLWRASTKLEYRTAPDTSSWLSTIAASRKMNENWTLLARNYYYSTKPTALGQLAQVQDRLQLGYAWRDNELNRKNVLGKYEYKLENNPQDVGTAGQRTSHIVSMHGDWRPKPAWEYTGRIAAKWSKEDFPGNYSSSYSAYLIGGRATVDLNPRWDAGLFANVLTGGPAGSSALRHNAGVELGYRVSDGLWLSGGLNFSGFRERDLAESAYTQRGLFLRLRFKFDETTFRSANPS